MLEKEPQINIENSAETKKISAADLALLLSEADDEFDKALDEKGYSSELKGEMELKLIERLKNKKENFKNVFETENGSVYFITQGEESLRFKKEKEEEWEYFKRQPIMNKIFFVDESTKNNLLAILKGRYGAKFIIDNEMELSDFETGKTPVEIGIIGFPEVIFDEYERDNKKYLKILGIKFKGRENLDKSFSSGIHIGHKIKNILK